jgi:hypothetical protein
MIERIRQPHALVEELLRLRLRGDREVMVPESRDDRFRGNWGVGTAAAAGESQKHKC